MKTNMIALLSFPSVLALGGASLAEPVTVAVSPDPATLDTPPAVYYRYEETTRKETAENVSRLFANLNRYAGAGLDATLPANLEDLDSIRLHLGDKHFYTLGKARQGFVYSRDLGRYVQPVEAPAGTVERRPPSSAQAIAIAKDYLAKLELLPADASEMQVGKVHAVGMAKYARTECVTQAAKGLTVVFFARRLHGLPVHGASRMVARIGNDGELVGLIRNWPKVTPVALDSASKILGKSQWKDATLGAVKRLENGSIHPTVSIESLEVVMYDDGRGCIEPALRAKGKRFDRHGRASAGTWTIPIMTEPKARYAATAEAGSAADADVDSAEP
jgi:hypothetical protein